MDSLLNDQGFLNRLQNYSPYSSDDEEWKNRQILRKKVMATKKIEKTLESLFPVDPNTIVLTDSDNENDEKQ